MKSARSSRSHLPPNPLEPRIAILDCLVFALFLATTSIAWAQATNKSATKFYPDFSDTADALLRNAASHARDGQWAEAIEIYQRVIQQFADKVARLPREAQADDKASESTLFVDLRQFCQLRLAALPPEARAIYRSRVDGQAERWYRQGVQERDRTMLRRVIDQAFCSSWGDDAIDLLGDLAFQDGRFEEALATYRQLVPDRANVVSGPIHPDPSVDLSRVAAKKLLCRAALGEDPPCESDLAAFAAAYPGATGSLAGRDGSYAETLAAALRLDRLAPPSQPDGRWPTFAGAPTRSRVVPGPIDVGSLQWRTDLEPVSPSRPFSGGPRGPTFNTGPAPPDRLLAYHPIVLGDQVIVCNEWQVLAYNLNDRPDGPPGTAAGAVKVAWTHEDDQAGPGIQATRNMVGVPRYTLTAFGDRIYARMGQTARPFIGMGRGFRGGGGGIFPGDIATQNSYIVALDRATDGKLLWKKPAIEVRLPGKQADGTNRNLGFEGTPVADARRVYVAMTDRREQTSTYVVCLDAENGSVRWVRYLGAASSDAEQALGMGMGMGMGMGGTFASDFGHRLLSLDGPTIYYQTNLGAVVALDAESGSIRWVATYPRLDRNGATNERDLNPAIIHDGLVIVAPEDAIAIYAFEASSGRLVWRSETLPDEVKLAHLLGVAKGRLVATGDRVLLFDVKTGKLLHTWPDNGHGIEGFGRGLLAGDKIYWPTRKEIHVLDQESGLISEPPIKLQETFQTSGGNLVLGDGYLIVSHSDQLVVFCQNRRLIQRYREEIARAPERAASYVQMAKVAEASGEESLALDCLARALVKARPSETIDGAPLDSAVRDQQFRLLMRLGDKSRAGRDLVAAEGFYQRAAAAGRGDRDRLRALLAKAEAQLDRSARAEAVSTLQSLLYEEPLRSLNVFAEGGRRTIRSDLFIGDRLAAILEVHGRELYAPFDREAKALLDRGKIAGDARELEEVCRSFPVAEVVPDALLALGRLNETINHPSEAVRAYKRLLALATDDATRAKALLGLARSYEAQQLWVPARDAYMQAITRFADVDVAVEDLGSGARLGTVVAHRLAQPPFDRMTGDRAEPILPVPLVRLWGRPLDRDERPIAAEGVPPMPGASRVFVVRRGSLRPIDSGSGESPWSADLGGPPLWVGFLDDRIVAATESRIQALDLVKGTPLWRFDAGAPAGGGRNANPFLRPEAARPGGEPDREPWEALHGLRIVGSRLFCLRGDRELLAIDGDSGLIAWSFSPTVGSINPNLWIGPQRVVLQTWDPNATLVLETATGRRRGEFSQPEGRIWPLPPLPIDDDHVALVLDKLTVALFDLERGVNGWVFRESDQMPKNGPPRLFGDAERLLLVHDGNELIRLDAATGTKRWSRPLGIEDLSTRPEAFALDGERVFWVSGRTLSAAALRDGTLSWRRPLSGPDMGWSIDLTERTVLAYPGLPRKVENELEGLPLVFRRRENGELVQRVVFPVTVTDVAVRLAPRGAFVATQSRLWALGERRPVDAVASGR